MKNEKKDKKKKWLSITAIAALLALLFFYVKLHHVNVPHELVGTWKTTNALYADRSLEIGGESMSFVTGGGTEYTGFISDIQSSIEGGKTLYIISYSVDSVANQVSFYYDSNNGGIIQFKNQQEVIWKKESGID